MCRPALLKSSGTPDGTCTPDRACRPWAEARPSRDPCLSLDAKLATMADYASRTQAPPRRVAFSPPKRGMWTDVAPPTNGPAPHASHRRAGAELKESTLPAIAVVAVLALAGVAISFVPAMQSSEAKIHQDAGPKLEKARRLLNQYRDNFEVLGSVLADWSATGLQTIALDDETIDELLETRRDDLAAADDRIRDHFGQRDTGRSEQVEERFLKAKFGGAWQSHHQRPARAIGPNLAQLREAVRSGRDARDRLIAENAALLAQAERALADAMKLIDEPQGPTFMQAQRLRGMIYYHQGVTAHRDAVRLRRSADKLRSTLASLVAQIDASVIEHILVDPDVLAQRLAEATAADRVATEEIADLENRLTDLRATAEDLHRRSNEQRDRVQTARAEMDRLADRGVDLTAEDGADRFADAYHEQAAIYRTALAAARALELGTLVNARIDDTRDLLHGDYVPADPDRPVTGQRGLRAVEADLHALEQRINAEKARAEKNRAAIVRMTEFRESLARGSIDARARTAALVAEAEQTWTDLMAADDQVRAARDQAIDKLTLGELTFDKSRMLARSWISAASDTVNAITNPEAKKRSSSDLLRRSGELTGYMRSQSADCSYRLGLVYFDRLRDSQRTLDLLDTARLVPGLERLGEDRMAGMEETLEDALENGSDALKAASDGWEQTGQSLHNHWTIAAELAVAMDALARFGDATLLDLAAANYEAAIDGSPDPSFVPAYEKRLKQLQ